MKIEIKGKEIELKYSFRALLFYENITDKSFAPNTVSDIIIFMYSVILSSDKSINLDFDDYLDYIDEKPNLVNEFSTWLNGVFEKNKMVSPEPSESDKKDVAEETEKKD